MKQLIAGFIFSLVFPFSLSNASASDLTMLAESGDADAQFSLAQMYTKGEGGVAKDDVAAAQWYSKAADLGHVEAKLELGRSYDGGRGVAKDSCRALYYIQNAAELGNVDAQWITGNFYVRGDCGQSDIARGLQWLELAEANGSPHAAGSLWLHHTSGKYGIEKNHEKAVYWLKKNVAKDPSYYGMASGAWLIAIDYFYGGPGLARDDQQALNWLYVSERIASNWKPQKNKSWFVKTFPNSMAEHIQSVSKVKEKIDPLLPEYMKAIASAAADDWWQQYSHQLKED